MAKINKPKKQVTTLCKEITGQKANYLLSLLRFFSTFIVLMLFGHTAQTSMPTGSPVNHSRQTAAMLFTAMWPEYKSQFITGKGNLIDSYHKISHSEGQGTVMLFAVYADDKRTFDLSWHWTRQNLQRNDALFAWRWQPDAAPPVTDYNNATDGDILIAWALLLAYEKWRQQQYLDEGEKILSAIADILIVNFGGFTTLLPGSMHFIDDNELTVNFSYYILPAFALFARYGDKQIWEKLYRDSLQMIVQTETNHIPLAPDWLNLNETGVLLFSDKQGARMGYDAIRVPLYLAWCGHQQALDSYRRFWKAQGGWKNAPSWIDLLTYEQSSYKPEPGILAVRSLAYPEGDSQLFRRYPVSDYFSVSLRMFSLLSVINGTVQCAF